MDTNTNATEAPFTSVTGKQLATYLWHPPAGTPVRGLIFLFHGLYNSTFYGWLDWSDASAQRGLRRAYQNSLVQMLNERGLIVSAHDHLGHGKSENWVDNVKGSVDKFDTIIQDSIAVVEWRVKAIREEMGGETQLPVFLLGESMGGTTAVQVAIRMPKDTFKGVVLLSPAVSTPDDMFGLKGKVLASLSAFIAWAFPQAAILELPHSPFENLYESFRNDELNFSGSLRAILGRGFLVAYHDIEQNLDKVVWPFLILYGNKDTLVSPSGMQKFADGAPTQDKTIKPMDGLWHELTKEPGNEVARKTILDWLDSKMSN